MPPAIGEGIRLPQSRPLVLHELVRGQQRVAACSPAAAALGVCVGMPMAEVLAAMPQIAHEAYDPQADRAALEALAVWCEQFSPSVGLETTFTPDSLLLDITGLGRLFGGEPKLVEVGLPSPATASQRSARCATASRSGRGRGAGGEGSQRFNQPSPPAPLPPTTSSAVVRRFTAGEGSGEQKLAEKLLAALAARGLTARAAIADTIGAAWAVAHYGAEGSGLEAASDRLSVISDQSLAYSVLRTSYSPPSTHAPPQKPEPRTLNPEPSPRILPVGDFSALLSLPLAALRLPPTVVDLFRQLGIERVEQLEGLPREALTARFGGEVLMRLDQALGRVAEPIVAQPAPPEFVAEGVIEFPTTRRDVLEALCEQLLPKLTRQLNERGLGTLRITCRLACRAAAGVDAEAFRLQTVPLSVGLFEPSAAPAHLLELLTMQFERLSLPGPVVGLTLSLPATAAIAHRQQSLFDDEPRPPSRRQLAALVERLVGRLGLKAVVGVQLAHEALPELAWQPMALVGESSRHTPCAVRQKEATCGLQRGSRDHEYMVPARPTLLSQRRSRRPAPSARRPAPSASDVPPRPTALLPRPEPVATTSIVPDGPPLQLTIEGTGQRIVAAVGPERIETGWWRGRMVARDYYRVETAAGRRYWVFRHLHDGRWFVHGRFD